MNRNQYFSKTVEKGLQILALVSQAEKPLSRAEISKATGINMTSTYRIIDTLISLGYLRKDSLTKRVVVGPEAFVVGQHLVQNFDIRSAIKPLLDNFYEEHHVTVDSAIYFENKLLLIYRCISNHIVKQNMPTMSTDLFHCTALGKAVLAWLPLSELETFLTKMDFRKLTPNTITSKSALAKDLDATRRRGYSINDEELLPGIISIGTPILYRNANRPSGAICFDFSTNEHTLQTVTDRYAQRLLELAAQISNFALSPHPV